jgi:hypothetical protein
MPARQKNPTDEEPLVLDIPVAGKLADMGRSASYAAAISGDMPTITIGGRKKVPGKLWRAILNGETSWPPAGGSVETQRGRGVIEK